MAPKGARGKGKGEKKKKDEKVLPLAVDITVKLPDESHVVLKVCVCSSHHLSLVYVSLRQEDEMERHERFIMYELPCI
ncbi:hypothetical protein B296_00058319 [Ensete ventricosum]|uniref:Uncharacterized protein n=1 Tax=Ensete ventricosum TaxID=4639 RepID=A0A426XBC7_ENSVE|nr:hypothetical protein B296_00058319 [Ensete ventricosum]